MLFTIEGKGTVEVSDEGLLAEWYLAEGRDRHYVDAQWFYDRLKGNEEGIYQFCSQFDHKTDSAEVEAGIQRYVDLYDKEVGDCGMDTCVFMMEVFLQQATGEPNLHWW